MAIFGTSIFISNYISQKKIEDVRRAEDRVSLDILSSETQFSLLEETFCKDVGTGFLSRGLSELSNKLSYAENQKTFSDSEIKSLQRSYFLLEIKDYLLMKRVTDKCGTHPTFILYFYGSKNVCPDCEKTGYVLDALHEKYPDLRIYSFDFSSEETAVKTLISIYHVESNLPALIINGDPYYGFRSLDEMEKTIPALHRLKIESERAQTASSTSATKKN